MASEWVVALSALGGAAIGAISSYFANIKVQEHNIKKKAEAIKAAMVAEIISIAAIARTRQYEQGLLREINILQNSPPGTKRSLGANIPSHYSRIYQENAKDIGLLKTEDAEKIIRFHQYTEAVVQDLIPDGVIYKGADINAFQEALNIYQSALSIADEIQSESSLK